MAGVGLGSGKEEREGDFPPRPFEEPPAFERVSRWGSYPGSVGRGSSAICCRLCLSLKLSPFISRM